MGLGGVGSWTVEALARSGVGSLTLVDLDDVCVSNINRQIHALTSTVGQLKGEVLAQRVADINPHCKVQVKTRFFTESAAAELLEPRYDCIVDAFDVARLKALLAAQCQQRGQPLVVVGGSGGRRDPTAVAVTDLNLTYNDTLLYRVRKTLRMRHGFPRGDAQWGIPTVYSTELPVFPQPDGSVCSTASPEGAPSRLGCANGYGAAAFVTGAFGFAAAARAVAFVTGSASR
jgi:tRNA A37 threonylcarbamoyladenosine dehydratase